MDAITEARPSWRTFHDVTVVRGPSYTMYVRGERVTSLRRKTPELVWILMESPGTVMRRGVLLSRLSLRSRDYKTSKHYMSQLMLEAQEVFTSMGLGVCIGTVTKVGYVLCALPPEENQNAPIPC